MEQPGELIWGRFEARLNRFLAAVEIAGKVYHVHVPTSGRMGELLVKDHPVMLKKTGGRNRKTDYDLIMACDRGTLVSIDSHLPNRLMFEALKNGEIEEFRGFSVIKKEHYHGESRIDLMLTGGGRTCLMEVKSVTLVVDGTALFPDSPTKRGAKHIRELIKARREGFDAAVVFVIQRDDAVAFSPNRGTDPEFADILAEAYDSDVKVIALKCRVDAGQVVLAEKVLLKL